MDMLPQEKLNQLSEAALMGDETAQQKLDEFYRVNLSSGQPSRQRLTYKLKLDCGEVARFTQVLGNFCRTYHEDGLESVYPSEWQRGFFDSRPIDEDGYPIEPDTGRSSDIIFAWRSKANEWQTILNAGARFTVAMTANSDYPMLLKIDSVMNTAQPFVLTWLELCKGLWDATPLAAQSAQPIAATTPAKDSGHYNFPREKRHAIVKEYRQARELGNAPNKNTWAQINHNITGRTLLNYEREFPTET